MAIAVFIGGLLKPYYKGLLPLLVVWAFGMGYSRIYIGVHYPLDLITGYSVGALLGSILLILIDKYVFTSNQNRV